MEAEGSRSRVRRDGEGEGVGPTVGMHLRPRVGQASNGGPGTAQPDPLSAFHGCGHPAALQRLEFTLTSWVPTTGVGGCFAGEGRRATCLPQAEMTGKYLRLQFTSACDGCLIGSHGGPRHHSS